MATRNEPSAQLNAGQHAIFDQYRAGQNVSAPQSAKLNAGQQATFDAFRNQGVVQSNDLTPATPFNFPTPPTPPTPSNPAIQAGLNASTQAREQAQTQTKSTLQQSIQDIMGLNNEIGNVGNTVDRTAEDTARKEADRYTSEIEAEQLANRRAIENLQKNNPQGLFGGALQDEVNRIDRDSLSKQADLAILQNSALRNYSTAKDIADREVQNKLEPLKIKLENLKFFYQENKELFNKEDDRLYNEKIKEQDREIAKQEKALQTISDLSITAIQNGAPASVVAKIRNSETVDEAYGFAGGYGVSLDDKIKRAQLNKLNATDKGEAPTIKSINGVDMQWDGSKWVTPTGGTLPQDINQILELEDKIKSIDGLIKDKGFAQSVGSTGLFGRGGTLQPGQRQNFIAGVQQLVSKDTLETLINLKAKGGTLGALSDQERIMLQSAATKIGFWAKTDKNGKVVSYQANEKDFKAELETIKRLTERAYDKATGGTESYLDTLDLILQETVNPYTQAGYILD